MSKHKKRKRATTKRRPNDPPGEFVTIYAPVWLASALKAEAGARRHSVSFVVVDALVDYFGLRALMYPRAL